ncbi:TraK domain-containing protein [Hydrogenophilus thermoluteolus]|uniref:TraK domain-containing protein n=1 Tax=Hydrogenophilus thermoluteolus TaxID=297 RepID=UPI0025572CED|nr:type-F conjugative transfer system secretin TraK [Hydrogenophilus thermoluteolus]
MATLLAASLEAHSAQVLTGKPDDTLSAVVSRSEPTMIRVDGHRIRRIFGAEGDFSVTPDQDTGVAYVKPAEGKKSFSLYVVDDAGRTWKLLLAVTDGPPDNIVIKGKQEASDKRWRDMARIQAIKRVIFALASDGAGDLDVRETNEVVPLWHEAMFVLVRVVDGPIKGEKYLLTNTSDKPMVIDERELYRKGVVAIAVEQPELKPAETTAVYVVAEGE